MSLINQEGKYIVFTSLGEWSRFRTRNLLDNYVVLSPRISQKETKRKNWRKSQFHWPTYVVDECWYNTDDVVCEIDELKKVGTRYKVDESVWVVKIKKKDYIALSYLNLYLKLCVSFTTMRCPEYQKCKQFVFLNVNFSG